MRAVPTPLSFAPELPFKFVGGDASLDLVNTIDWTRRGQAQERLTDYLRLLEWAGGAGVLSTSRVAHLRALAGRSPEDARAALEAARRCRAVLRRMFEAVVAGRRSAEALAEFDAVLREAHEHRALAWPSRASEGRAGPPLRWEWRDADTRLDAVLWPVVHAAATLLASDEAAQLRICGGADCGWMYVDRSRNGLRRWCEMRVCGTREKSRRRAVRREAGR